ncbi:MAG: FAD-binding oxidoreductase, partial [Fimbriimonadaceae bacterium]|nr:FAD-binding oxidoreductase [Alphaproteobacteria bacterium]
MIVIVGAGIAGLSLGWRLAQSGAPVTVIEQNKIGSAASYAAAAYLEPRLGTGAMRELEWAAVGLWRRFAQEVEDSAGQSIDYRRDGQLRIAYKETNEKVVADHKQRILEGWRSEWMDAAELRRLEPNLSDEVVAGSYLPDVDWCDGRKLCAALSRGIVNAGGRVME